MNMFKPTGAQTDEEYITMLSPERRKIIETLDKIIQASSPTFKRYFAYNMLGYGSFKYKNYKKEEIDWPIIALASQKNYISLYVCCISDGKYLAERSKEKLGKVSVGKSCIRFKKLEDLNLESLKELLIEAAKNPGLV
jgi:hypothetical protein